MTRLADIDVKIHVETKDAVKVSTDGDSKNAVWLPRSQIEIEEKRDGSVIVTMPERLAIEKGLV